MKTITIECDTCSMRHSEACEDCVVSYLLGREPDDAVVFDVEEARAVRLLEEAGLLPSLRYEGLTG